jgi:NADPH:quinone reductase
MEAAASAAAGGYSRYGSAVHKQVYIYGSLDRGPTELTRSYGMAWGIGGWLLTPFLQKVGLPRVAQLRDQVAAGLTTTFASSYTAQVSLPGALSLDAIAGYGRQPTGSKFVIIPSRAAYPCDSSSPRGPGPSVTGLDSAELAYSAVVDSQLGLVR